MGQEEHWMQIDQAVFDEVGLHLLQQGKKSVLSTGMGAYRSADGCRCAIGKVIPDDKYTPSLEGKQVFSDEVWPIVSGARPGASPGLCLELQMVHDRHDPANWYQQLTRVAKRHGLSFDAVDAWRAAQADMSAESRGTQRGDAGQLA